MIVAVYFIASDVFQLHQPDDESYTDYWVDFNTSSQRVSLFCRQEPDDTQTEVISIE